MRLKNLFFITYIIICLSSITVAQTLTQYPIPAITEQLPEIKFGAHRNSIDYALDKQGIFKFVGTEKKGKRVYYTFAPNSVGYMDLEYEGILPISVSGWVFHYDIYNCLQEITIILIDGTGISKSDYFKLCDVFLQDFKKVFGNNPKTFTDGVNVSTWYWEQHNMILYQRIDTKVLHYTITKPGEERSL